MSGPTRLPADESGTQHRLLSVQACGKDDEALIARIEAICAEFPGTAIGVSRHSLVSKASGSITSESRASCASAREREAKARQAVRRSDGGCRKAVFPNLAVDSMNPVLIVVG